MSYCFEITALAEICIKICYFYRKIEKNRPAMEDQPPDPDALPNPPLRNPSYATVLR